MLSAKKTEWFVNQIAYRCKSNRPLELLVGFENDKRRKTIRQLKKIGKIVAEFEFLPYVALRCDYPTGRKIADFLLGIELLNRDFYVNDLWKTFSRLDNVTSWEVSGNVKNPPVKVGGKSARPKKSDGLWNLENIGAYEAQKL